MERRWGGKIFLRLHDRALGKVPQRGVVFDIETDVVTRVTKRLQGTEVEHRIALRVNRGQNRGSDGNVHAAQRDQCVDGFFRRCVRRGSHR